jgi:hypothetical protein
VAKIKKQSINNERAIKVLAEQNHNPSDENTEHNKQLVKLSSVTSGLVSDLSNYSKQLSSMRRAVDYNKETTEVCMKVLCGTIVQLTIASYREPLLQRVLTVANVQLMEKLGFYKIDHGRMEMDMQIAQGNEAAALFHI